MKILLDTHIALWCLTDSKKINSELADILTDPENDVYYSIVSVWEIAIKHQLNRNNMPLSEEDFADLCEQSGFSLLNVAPNHIFNIKTLKRDSSAPKHNDPFDRLLLSQAKTDLLTFVTHDSLIPRYGEKCVMYV